MMMDIATGFSIEPPTACTMRKMMSVFVSGATLHSNEPAVKMTSPVMKTRLRPIRSPIDADSMSRLAIARV